METKKKKKLFRGRSRLIVDPGGKIREFYTRAASRAQGEKQLQRKMNAARGYVAEALLPMDVEEIAYKARR